jgi:hypothetical protein
MAYEGSSSKPTAVTTRLASLACVRSLYQQGCYMPCLHLTFAQLRTTLAKLNISMAGLRWLVWWCQPGQRDTRQRKAGWHPARALIFFGSTNSVASRQSLACVRSLYQPTVLSVRRLPVNLKVVENGFAAHSDGWYGSILMGGMCCNKLTLLLW